ncbi:187-kDa microtubule-associated protein, partial [Mucuna pruriens]
MEVSSEQSGEDMTPEKPESSPKKNVPEVARRAAKTAADSGGSVSAKRKVEPRSGSGSGAGSGTVATKRSSSISGSGSSVSAPRRNSTGGLLQKASISDGRRKIVADSSAGAKSSASSATEPARRSLPELRRSSVTSSRAGVAAKPGAASPAGSASRTSGASKVEVAKKPVSKPTLSASASASSLSRRISSSSVDSTGSSGGSARRTVSRVSSPTVSSGLRAGSLSTSLDRTSALSGRRKGGTPDSRESRFIVLPQVEIKANDDLRLDLRGHRVRSLNASGLNLSSNLEFVYLRDNLLSTLEGVEILTRVKGPGFEPLENCKVLQRSCMRAVAQALQAQACQRNDGRGSKNKKGNWKNKLKDSNEGPKISNKNFGGNNYKKNGGHEKFSKKGGDQNRGGQRKFDKCYACKKWGHFVDECYNKGKAKERG